MHHSSLFRIAVLLLTALASTAVAQVEKPVIDPDPTIIPVPGEPKTYLARGNAWLAKEKYDKAVADYTMSIEFDSSFADAYFNRGYAYRMKHEFDRAMADYNTVSQLQPKAVDALNNRGVIWCLKGSYNQAISEFDHVLQIDPNNLVAKANRARLLGAKDVYETLRDRGDLPELEDAYIRFSD